MAVVHLIKVPLYKNFNRNFYIKYTIVANNHIGHYRRRINPYLGIGRICKSVNAASKTSTNIFGFSRFCNFPGFVEIFYRYTAD